MRRPAHTSLLAGWRARACLRPADRVGPGARVVGWPLLRNMGRMEIGERFRISGLPIRTHLITWPGATLAIGRDVTISHGVSLAAKARIEIGDGACIGPFAIVLDTNFHHPGDWKDARPRVAPVRIGPGAVVGAGVVLLPGSDVGEGARVAPGTVVHGRVAPGTEVAGNPARPSVGHAPGSRRAGGIEGRVCRVIADVFGLEVPPSAEARRRSVDGWSTLGGLRLLLALEEEFGVVLDDVAFMSVETVGDVVAAVGSAGVAPGGAGAARAATS